jgi:DNA-binding FadR family transcriptional regulator
MSIETIDDRRPHRQIAGPMVRLLEAGKYPMGDCFLSKQFPAERFPVSRPIIREALVALGRIRLRTLDHSDFGTYPRRRDANDSKRMQ